MALRMTEEEFSVWSAGRNARQVAATSPWPIEKKRPKYGNRRVETPDGKKFDSQHEADVYAQLMARVMAGELKTVARQVRFDLPGGIQYVADFVTFDRENRAEVLDAKSEITRQNRTYINKRKQMANCLGLTIREV